MHSVAEYVTLSDKIDLHFILSMDSKPVQEIKVSFVGDADTGKTVTTNIITDTCGFEPKYVPTLGVNVLRYNNVSIWDIAGNPRYSGLGSSYCIGTHKIVLFVDSATAKGREGDSKWFVKKMADHSFYTGIIPRILVISKMDKEEVNKEKLLETVGNFFTEGIVFISSKTGEGLAELKEMISS